MAGGLAPSCRGSFHGGAKGFVRRQHGGEGFRVEFEKIGEARRHYGGVTGLTIEEGQLPEEIAGTQKHGARLR